MTPQQLVMFCDNGYDKSSVQKSERTVKCLETVELERDQGIFVNKTPQQDQMQYDRMFKTNNAFFGAAEEVTAFDTSFTDTRDFKERDGLAQTARVLNECSLFKMQQNQQMNYSVLSQRDDAKGQLPHGPDRQSKTGAHNTPHRQQQSYAPRHLVRKMGSIIGRESQPNSRCEVVRDSATPLGIQRQPNQWCGQPMMQTNVPKSAQLKTPGPSGGKAGLMHCQSTSKIETTKLGLSACQNAAQSMA